jgi:TPR repeat protein
MSNAATIFLRFSAALGFAAAFAAPALAQPAPPPVAACIAASSGMFDAIEAARALPACEAALAFAPNDQHLLVKLGRALQAGKQFARARTAYEQAAEQGNTAAMHNLGTLFGGFGEKLDLAEATRWYERAAAAGNSDSMVNLGYLLAQGIGGKRDEARALHWFRKAAEAGNSYGMFDAAAMLAAGKGGARNEAEAALWFRKAAEAGHAPAMTRLGSLLVEGRGGLQRNYEEAAGWFRKAAEAGDPAGMTRYGFELQKGRGVKQDNEAAKSWYRKAAALGSETAKYNLARLEGKPDPGDRAARGESGGGRSASSGATLIPNGCRGGGHSGAGGWRCN